MRLSPQAQVQLANLGLAEAEVVVPAAAANGRVRIVDADGPLRVLVVDDVIESVRRPRPPSPKPSTVPMTAHARARAAERGITAADIAAALAAPRGPRGVHTFNGVAVAVAPPRGQRGAVYNVH